MITKTCTVVLHQQRQLRPIRDDHRFFSCEFCEFESTARMITAWSARGFANRVRRHRMRALRAVSMHLKACLVATNASGAMRSFSATTALGADLTEPSALRGCSGGSGFDFFNEDPANPLVLTTYDMALL